MDRVARKINNKKGIVGAMILMGGLEVIFGLTVFNTVTLVIMMLCGVAVGMSAYYVLAYTMVYDVAEVASLKLGKDSSTGAGTFIAFFQCAQKIGGAIGMWFAGIMLSFYKYDPNNITEYTVNGIRFIATTLPGIVCIVSGLLILVLYKMNPDDYRKLSGMVGKDELTAEEQALVDRTL